MDKITKSLIWNQFGASIDTLANAIEHCPDNQWADQNKYHQIWYMAFHTIFWLDFYLSVNNPDFQPPPPFTMSELDPSGIIPDPPYSKQQLISYLKQCRSKAYNIINDLSEKEASALCPVGKIKIRFDELLLYIMRHIQHHAAQINLLLRFKTDSATGWVFQAIK